MIRIVIDSSSDYQLQEATAQNMEFVSISVTVGEQSYMDGVNLDRDEFYKNLAESTEFPKTAQPSPQAFLDIFQHAKECGDDVICILLSSGLSGTCQSAHLAKNMAEYDNIYIVDSLSATIGIKILVEYADKLRNENVSAAEIAAKLEDVKARIRIFAGVDTLEFLCRGGRVSHASAAIGELANIKPIINVNDEGKVVVLGKCLGKNKALRFIMDKMEEAPADGNFPIYTVYTYGTENTEKLEDKLTKAGTAFTSRQQIGATIGAHVGPGAFGVIYIEK